jgi:hypothetical protein
MTNTVNYQQIIPFISKGKIDAIRKTFGPTLSDRECYGIYIWAQKASSSIYPLLQQLEITLRNSIDKEARKYIGDHWWDSVYTNNAKTKHDDFIKNINKAKIKYKKEYHKKNPSANFKSIKTPHDDIIAHTDFYTWQAVLSDAFHSGNRKGKAATTPEKSLWPRLTYKVLKGLNRTKKEETARIDFINDLNEIRNYRNRLSHNDCVWIKINSNNLQSAIETVREKINKIEDLIKTINPHVHETLIKWGMFYHARRICSKKEAEYHMGIGIQVCTDQQMRSVLSILYSGTEDGKTTNVVNSNNNNIAIHRF